MSNGTLTVEIRDVDSQFQFQEAGNTTNGAVFFDPVQRTVIVVKKGNWDLTFNASGFLFLSPPVIWEGSKPDNVHLREHKDNTFTLLNAVTAFQEPIKFLIRSDIKIEGSESAREAALYRTVDPTILNNPQPGGGVQAQQEEEVLLTLAV